MNHPAFLIIALLLSVSIIGGAFLSTSKFLVENTTSPPKPFKSEDGERQFWEWRYERGRQARRKVLIVGILVVIVAIIGAFI